MQITLIAIGKTDAEYIRQGMETYAKRLGFYVRFEVAVIPDIRNSKNMSQQEQKRREGELILAAAGDSDCLALLDEGGREHSSVEFAAWLQKKMNAGVRKLCFVIGGPYGFSDEVYARANEKLSLSRMTFSHQMVRLIFAEQLYRAFTIINNEPYHHS